MSEACGACAGSGWGGGSPALGGGTACEACLGTGLEDVAGRYRFHGGRVLVDGSMPRPPAEFVHQAGERCWLCGKAADGCQGLPVADGELVAPDYQGEWGGVAGCRDCVDRYDRGELVWVTEKQRLQRQGKKLERWIWGAVKVLGWSAVFLLAAFGAFCLGWLTMGGWQ